ncbi:hypothetical protein PPL_07805 [Heterostelium album PN500]|uniref:Uncharacterized protein n=1 Tax=Heterostelium pallidum (strain ATCC 26659 / Pp 5 / PN500) TaxID=670386 RepID=D3BH03_HETP5|nr:hypothetical protein PPL_07805 [Heterostelium album PN500]EFA79387.1 hypothetical protein PPL_07805 [Heterostelium album PN500]|eukprot:XP_020431508.1 hypothetical protein PPL_07805 [Heterostelium album PN500]
MSEGRKKRASATPASPKPNVELMEQLTQISIPIILPPSYKPEAKYEKYVNQLVGKIIMSAALISKIPGPKLKNTLLSQKGLLIKFNETIQICDAIAKNNLHLELVSVSGTKCRLLFKHRSITTNTNYCLQHTNQAYLYKDVITTVKERSYYGVNTNLSVGGGIIIVVLEKVILVALFPASVLPAESIPFVENFVSSTIIS